MNLYLKTEKLDDIESFVANKEQQRLQDLLIFIAEYTNEESNISLGLEFFKIVISWYASAHARARLTIVSEPLLVIVSFSGDSPPLGWCGTELHAHKVMTVVTSAMKWTGRLAISICMNIHQSDDLNAKYGLRVT